MKKIAITGASGFVGSQLVELLSLDAQVHIIALSRHRKGIEKLENGREIEWRQCDLYSLLDIENALEGIETAFYLVHSMSPSAGLVQGTFDELDLLLADNFAKAAKKSSLKHLVYLGGLIPEGEPRDWSVHLKSRYEVEEILIDSEIKVSIFRAGLIIGSQGSSLEILRRLIHRLPIMICPAWTLSQSSAISLQRVCECLEWAVSHPPDENFKVYDLGETAPLSYREMMTQMAEGLGLRRFFIPVPLFTPKLSRLWVSVVTGAPRSLVYPLVMSLKHTLLPRASHRCPRICPEKEYEKSFKELVFEVVNKDKTLVKAKAPHAYNSFFSTHKTVRSVQREDLVCEIDSKTIATEYMKWLPKFFYPFILVKTVDDQVFFHIRGLKKALLVLSLSQERSSDERQLFYIQGGLLAKETDRGRLEFRVLKRPRCFIAAIHDFKPALPWRVYKYTQALVHLFVMRSYGKHVNKKFFKA